MARVKLLKPALPPLSLAEKGVWNTPVALWSNPLLLLPQLPESGGAGAVAECPRYFIVVKFAPL